MSEMPTSPEPAERQGLGTFLGVFTPTILTILGVIMYLKLGWVVGTAGLLGALGIVVFSHLITLVTSLSLSALATNMRVGVGGAYYLISRTLGLEVGGAIGIPLYLSQALSVTLYCYGLAVVLFGWWDNAPIPLIAAVLVVIVGLVAAKSTELTLKLQLPMLGLIIASIVSMLLGVEWGGEIQVDNLGPWRDLEGKQTVGMIFAVFFPAVTGILAGVSLSGDLKDPGKSIPRGVLSAVGVGFVVYMIIPFALAYSSPELLQGDSEKVWTSIAAVPLLVIPGMCGAILSSAFGSILGAPRTLQALAQDRLAPQIFGEVDEESGEPIWALRVSIAVALGAVLLGDLETVATVLTMFFLTTYGTLNLVAGLEELVGDPSFRPRIRVPWWASFLAGLGCIIAMFAISALGAAVALVIVALIYVVLSRRTLEATWGDVRGGMLLTAARFALIRLRDTRLEPRNWRPHILVFTTDIEERIASVRLAQAFGQHRGITTVMTLLVGDADEHAPSHTLAREHQELLDDNGVMAFCEVATVPDLHAGVITCAQANGFAGLESNTAMFGWPAGDDAASLARMLTLVRKLDALGKCALIHRTAPIAEDAKREIVVWWAGKEHNGDLMLLLAHLLSGSRENRDLKIVLKSIADSAEDAVIRQRELAAMLDDIRIAARFEVVLREEGQSLRDVIRQYSADASIVFLGMTLPDAGSERSYANRMIEMTEGLPPTILVRNGGPFRGRLV